MVAAAKSAVTTPEIYSTFTKRSKLKSKDMNQETQEPKRVRAVQLGQMLKMEFAPDIQLLGQLIFAKTIGMIAGPRGGGKSLLSMLMSYAVAGGKELAPWGNGSGMPVAYFDGEMRAISFQSRLRLLHARNEAPGSMRNVQKNLHIISRDFAKDVIGYIDQVEGQRRIDALIPDEVKLIVIDNLSAWTSGGREDGGSWATIKAWLIEKRLQGKSVLLVHHTGKNGKQRGSSAHEDLLDYSILLSPTANNGDEQDSSGTNSRSTPRTRSCTSMWHRQACAFRSTRRRCWTCTPTTSPCRRSPRSSGSISPLLAGRFSASRPLRPAQRRQLPLRSCKP